MILSKDYKVDPSIVRKLREALSLNKTEINIVSLGSFDPSSSNPYQYILNNINYKNNVTNIDIRSGLKFSQYLATTMNSLLWRESQSSIENPTFRLKEVSDYFKDRKYFVNYSLKNENEINLEIKEGSKSKISRLLSAKRVNFIEEDKQEKFINTHSNIKNVTISLPDDLMRLGGKKNFSVGWAVDGGSNHQLGFDYQKINFPVLEGIVRIELFQDLLLNINKRFKDLRAISPTEPAFNISQKELKDEAILLESIFRKNLNLLDAFLNIVVNKEDLDGALWGAATSSLRDGFIPFSRNIKHHYCMENRLFFDNILNGLRRIKNEADYFYITSIMGLTENILGDAPKISHLNQQKSSLDVLNLLKRELINENIKNQSIYLKETVAEIKEARNLLFAEIDIKYPLKDIYFEKDFQKDHTIINLENVLENSIQNLKVFFKVSVEDKNMVEVDISNFYELLNLKSESLVYKALFDIAICKGINACYSISAKLKDNDQLNELALLFREDNKEEFFKLFNKYNNPKNNNKIIIKMGEYSPSMLKNVVQDIINTMGTLISSSFKNNVIQIIQIEQAFFQETKKRIEIETQEVFNHFCATIELFNEDYNSRDDLGIVKNLIREKNLKIMLDNDKKEKIISLGRKKI